MDAMSFMNRRLAPDLQQELDTHTGEKSRVLAHGSGEEATVVATTAFLGLRHQGEWETWGWEEILRGSWKADQSAFAWTTTDGRRIQAALDSVGRLPELFRERVQASTVVTETHDLPRGSIQIVGRRRLDGSDEMTWYAAASGGASLGNPDTAAFVVERTDQLKADWKN